MKEIGFPSFEDDFFVTIDHMELTRGFLLVVEITSLQIFRLCVSFRNFHLVKEYPLLS